MKRLLFPKQVRLIVQIIAMVAVFLFSLGIESVNIVQASPASNTEACGKLLSDAEARFQATLTEDGSVPASAEVKAAAQEYIRVSKLCYEEIQSQSSADVLQDDTPIYIDDGAAVLGGESAEFVLTNKKWGLGSLGTPGGTVTYSFMGNGISLSTEGDFSVALSSLPNFQACFITEIQTAFAAWQTVANINFVQVNDNGVAFNAPGATGDIRIGAHAFDGVSGTLAHAYYPPPNGNTAAGDLHFDSAENWSCNNSGIDIGIVALHEIGHSIGLAHEDTGAVAVMDPYYNSRLTGLQPDDTSGASAIYGLSQLVAPSNDDFDHATVIDSIAYTSSINVLGATEAVDDPNPINPCSSDKGNISLKPGWRTVWYKYAPQATESIALDTFGSDYDTFIAVWIGSRGSLNLVQCNDDPFETIQSELSFVGTYPTTYYIEVGEYSGESADPLPSPKSSYGSLKLNVYITNTEVNIAGNLMGRYYVSPSESMRRTYLETNNGPAKVISTNGKQTLTSQRVIYGGWSYSEMMGLPAEQLTKEYLFPYYNNVAMDSQLRVSNVGGADTTIKVYLAGNQIDSYTLAAGGATRKNYTGKNNGPLRVTSSASNILTTIRVLYGGSSYSELMGLPVGQLTNEYLFPYYNNVAMDSQLRVSNVGGVPTTITVYLGSNPAPIDSYTLAAGGATRKNYTGKNSGPLRVTSSASNILTTIRVLYGGSLSELMGFPTGQLEQEYWYPVYDNAALDSQLRVSNVGSTTTTITVYAGTEQIDSYSLNAGAATRKNYPKNTGPLHVVSSTQPILTTIRLLYGASYYEVTGLPESQLSTQYFFPWYNNKAMSSQLRFAVP